MTSRLAPVSTAATRTPLLAARGLGVMAGGQALLSNVELDLNAAELVALVGPSGCGKTTLLRAICALDDATAGEVLLQSRAPREWGYPEFRRRVLLVDQRPILFDDSLEANLRRPFAYRSAPAAFPRERALALLERVGLGTARLTQNARSLSIGQQQRASLVRALLLEPLIFLLDEPTSALDGEAVAEVEAVIREDLSARGAAALVITHSRAQAQNWCDREIDVTQWRVAPSVPEINR